MCSWGLEEWGYIANIVIAVASVATAIVTAIALWKQYNLQQEQLNTQQLEHQPIFDIAYSDDGLCLSIKNIGQEVTKLFDIDVDTFILVGIETKGIMGLYVEKTFAIPIKYYNQINQTKNLTGSLLNCQLDKRNRDMLAGYEIALHKQISKKYECTSVFVYHIDLISIRYKDIYGKFRASYYRNTHQTQSNFYNQVVESANLFCDKPIQIENLDIEEVVNAAEVLENYFEL